MKHISARDLAGARTVFVNQFPQEAAAPASAAEKCADARRVRNRLPTSGPVVLA